MGRFLLGVLLSVAATAAAQPPPAPTLPQVLKLVAVYVAEYQTKLAGIVAEEQALPPDVDALV